MQRGESLTEPEMSICCQSVAGVIAPIFVGKVTLDQLRLAEGGARGVASADQVAVPSACCELHATPPDEQCYNGRACIIQAREDA